MLSCFNNPIKITQKFGNELYLKNKKVVSKNTKGAYGYYGQFGLKGHNGLDCIPTGKDKGIFNIYPGKILKIEKHTAYGWRVLIWNQEKQIIEYHNHMQYINKELKMGQIVTTHTYMGKMGNTGYSLGPHNHLAYRETDKKGYILNLDNGYNGYVDPLKYIST